MNHGSDVCHNVSNRACVVVNNSYIVLVKPSNATICLC